MKLLDGAELASYIKVRQAKQVRRLKQTDHIQPKLLILKTTMAGSVIDTYVRMKQRYAEDIGVTVDVITCADDEMVEHIHRANTDDTIQGIVVQLPLENIAKTQTIVDSIAPEKDVDGLGENADYISATAEAIDWLLAGHGVELGGKKITLIGRGKLVGAPLETLWRQRGLDVSVITRETDQTTDMLRATDVIISAAGSAHIVRSADVAHGAVVVDAGTVSEDGKIVGDVHPEVYERRDVTITPQRGGVGPLTIVMMFDHVIRACFARVSPD